MSLVTNVVRRGGSYYFRVRVPKSLIALIGRAELWKSLRTTNIADARMRAATQAVLTETLWTRLRGVMDMQTATAFVKDWLTADLRAYASLRDDLETALGRSRDSPTLSTKQPRQVELTPEAPPQAVSGLLLSKAGRDFVVEVARSGQVKVKRVRDYESALRAFYSWLGDDLDLAAITPSLAGQFKTALTNYPARGSVRPDYRTLDFRGRVELAIERGEADTLDAVSINNKYLGPIRAMFEHYRSSGFRDALPINPFEGVAAKGARKASKEQRRRDFTVPELQRLLDQPLFTGSAATSLGGLYQSGAASVASNLLPLTASSGAGNGSLTATTTSTWDVRGDLKTVDGPLSGAADTTWYAYDVLRRQVGIVAPDPDGGGSLAFPATRTTFDADGLTTSAQQGTTTGQNDTAFAAFTQLSRVDTAYDSQGRKIRDTQVLGTGTIGLTQYSYDAGDRLTCAAVRMNPAVYGSLPSDACTLGTAGSFGDDRIARNTYDAANRVTVVTSAYGTSLAQTARANSYTPNGKLDWVQDANRNRSDYAYDTYDRLAQLNFPATVLGSQAANPSDYEAYGYDANGNITSRRLRSADTLTFTYDALNRETVKTVPGSGTANDVFSTYDNLSRRLSARFNSASSSDAVIWTWDALGRPLTESTYGRTLTSAYDLAGRRTSLTWPSSALQAGYDWDLANRMTTTWDTSGMPSGANLFGAYSYDDLGRRTALQKGGGASSWSYTANSRDWSLTVNLAGTTNDVTYAFGFNPAGQAVTRSVSNTAYRYAPPATSQSYSRDGLNRYTAVGAASYTYDAYGQPAGGAYTGPRFRYTGQTSLPGAPPLWHYKARAYAPGIGRFLQVDPIGYKDSLNVYLYGQNDPANRADPTGLFTCDKSIRTDRCADIQRAVERARRSGRKFPEGSKSGLALNAVLDVVGNRGDQTGVVFRIGTTTSALSGGNFLGNESGGGIITLSPSIWGSNGADMSRLTETVVHEGTHAATHMGGMRISPYISNIMNIESAAYRVQFYYLQGDGAPGFNEMSIEERENWVRRRAVRSMDEICEDYYYNRGRTCVLQ